MQPVIKFSITSIWHHSLSSYNIGTCIMKIMAITNDYKNSEQSYWWVSDTSSTYSFSHSTLHLQRAVHFNAALEHLHRPLHPFLHPHLSNSWHDLAASGSVLHCGSHCLTLFLSQPQSPGSGRSGAKRKAWPHTCPPWYTALHMLH